MLLLGLFYYCLKQPNRYIISPLNLIAKTNTHCNVKNDAEICDKTHIVLTLNLKSCFVNAAILEQ